MTDRRQRLLLGVAADISHEQGQRVKEALESMLPDLRVFVISGSNVSMLLPPEVEEWPWPEVEG